MTSNRHDPCARARHATNVAWGAALAMVSALAGVGAAAPSDYRGAKAAAPTPASATTALATDPRPDATVALNFQDIDIPVLAKFVSEVTGRNFIIDDRVRGKVTIISPTRLTPDEADRKSVV